MLTNHIEIGGKHVILIALEEKLPPLKVCYQSNSWDTYAVR